MERNTVVITAPTGFTGCAAIRHLLAKGHHSHASFQHWLPERVPDWSGLALTHLRPPFFAEWMLSFAPMIRQGQVYAPFASGKAAFMRDSIAAGSAKSGQNNALSGFGESKRPKGAVEPPISQHLQAAHRDFEAGRFSAMNHAVERITHIPPMNVAQFVAEHRQAFV